MFNKPPTLNCKEIVGRFCETPNGSTHDTGVLQIDPCQHCNFLYLSRLMPKPIARSKTRKSVAKRFKITARGKILRAHSSRRHLLSSKNAKRRRHLGKTARVHDTDVARIKANLPFG
jgi:large subunit ribosomal protein L35